MTAAAPALALDSSRAPRPIPVRRPEFDFDGVPAHWFGGDAFLTHLGHALSITFPEGERFFMDAVRHYQPRITSPALRAEITRFLGQEALHARAHSAYNEWARTLGIDTAGIEKRITEDLEWVRQNRPHKLQLAMTCALEHFTAMMAELLLDSPDLRAMMHPAVRDLWVWHALEETEHKAVAFDTYVAVGGTYRMRALSMLMTTIGFTLSIAVQQEILMRQDARLRGASGLWTRLRGFRRLWLWPGYFLPLVPKYLAYFRPDFHPWQRSPKSDLDAFRRQFEGSVVRT